MDKVKRLVRIGVSLSVAVREALPMKLQDFAAKHGLPRTALSAALNGQRGATDAMIAALVAEIGGSAEEWRALVRDARIAAARADAAPAIAAG